MRIRVIRRLTQGSYKFGKSEVNGAVDEFSKTKQSKYFETWEEKVKVIEIVIKTYLS